MKPQTRRKFLVSTSAGAMFALTGANIPFCFKTKDADKLALLGGKPIRSDNFPSWPVWDEQDENAVIPVLRSGVWSRAGVTTRAEQKFAELMGSKYCLLTTNGTNALITSLRALGIEGGDEVITTPYTFVASIDAIFLNNALPVFVDIDPETWQMNANLIEKSLNKNTKAIMPVHVLGGMCDMERVMSISKTHDLKVVEDACEAHMAEWNGKKAGTIGDLGCFSLQNGKQMTCGEGGAIIGDDEQIMDICYSFHNFGRTRGRFMPQDKGATPILGTKARITEFQASILMTQMDSIESETKRRLVNSNYLTSKIKDIPGIVPRKNYLKNNRPSCYFYAFRFKEQEFGITRDTFIKALKAEGIPADDGLGVIEKNILHKEGVVESVINSRTYRKLYSKKRLDAYRASLHLPESEQLVKETVGFKHYNLLGPTSDMDDISKAIIKIYENRDKLKG